MSDGLSSEEDVKFKFLVPYLEGKGYKKNCMDFNVAVDVQEGRKKKTIFADLVVYASSSRKAPLIVCETKASTEVLDRTVREQAISYARLLPRIAPLALATNGLQVQVFHTLDKTRLANLPSQGDLRDDIVRAVLNKDTQEALRQEAKHELFIIDDVRMFKSILKSCHNEIRNNEGLDPIAAFDEMSKVMFCKLYEEKENSQSNRFRLSTFDDSMKRLNVNVVRQIFDEAKKDQSYSGLFAPEAAINLKDRTTRRIVELFESYDLGLTAFDIKGEAFEYFLGETFTGGLGEYFTPRNVVEFMVEAISPRIGEKIVDPFCGTGGFMIRAFELVNDRIRLQDFSDEEKERWRYELSNQSLYGTDWKERTSQACKMNMMVHGDGSSGVFMHDGFADVPGKIEEGKFNVCLTNPPFGSRESDPKTLARYELGAGRKSQDRVILALERALRLVRPGGRIGIVVIDGILNNSGTKYVRDYVKRHAWIRGVVSLNAETFQGYGARAKTSVLFLEKKAAPDDDGQQGPVFMAVARNTGLAPNGDPIPGNVLPDILLDYRAFQKGETSLPSHAESWRTEVADRLDAEYYARTAQESTDVEKLRHDLTAKQREATNTYLSLADAETLLGSVEVRPTRLSEILEEVSVKEKVSPDRMYRLLGVRWWGDGVFVREEKLGKKISASALHRVSAGWIIYNRLFAFRGSFAMVGPDQDGCYVSSEFPTFRPKGETEDDDMLCRYVVHCLNSPQYLSVVDAESTGSTKTSRNRFREGQFLALTVQVPTSADDLRAVVRMLDNATELRRQQEALLDLTKGFREGVFRMLPGPSRDGPG